MLLALSSQLPVFSNLCIMNAVLRFCYVSHAVVSGTYPCVARISSKALITVGWVWWRHQRASLFSFASPPQS